MTRSALTVAGHMQVDDVLLGDGPLPHVSS
jgi:hypothetical protein